LNNLVIEKTRYTPEIKFLTNGKLCISGFSIPENSLDVYTQPLNWLQNLKSSDPMPIQLDFKFDFLDSSSVRSVTDMVKILNTLSKNNQNKVQVNWFYEDDDMRETGDDLSSVADVEFNVIQKDINDLEY
jgi:hypothetical protein